MDIFTRQFGLMIAYVLPGFLALAGVAPLLPIVALWLRGDQTSGLGAPLYALLAATGVGLVVSCFRWLILDHALVRTGVASPKFNARALQHEPAALQFVIENHYRYYQFFGNTLLALIWTYIIYRWLRTSPLLRPTTDIVVIILCGVLLAGARDALRKYRERSAQLTSRNKPHSS